MVDYYPRRSRLIFQVDVFPAHGRIPTNLAEVTERDKDIRYSSRMRLTTNNLSEKHNVRHAINELHKLLPPELGSTEQAQRLYAYGCVTEMDIVQLIYRPMEPLGAFKDFEFSCSTMAARSGLAVVRTDAGGARCARVRRDARHPHPTLGSLSNSTASTGGTYND